MVYIAFVNILESGLEIDGTVRGGGTVRQPSSDERRSGTIGKFNHWYSKIEKSNDAFPRSPEGEIR